MPCHRASLGRYRLQLEKASGPVPCSSGNSGRHGMLIFGSMIGDHERSRGSASALNATPTRLGEGNQMNAEDFQNLYMLLRGSKSAFAVLDARTLFQEKNHITALERVEEARSTYAQSRSRLMKQPAEKQVDPKAADADKQIKRIERKQGKVTEILKAFDEMIPKLKKLADRDALKAERAGEVDSKAIVRPDASPETPSGGSDGDAGSESEGGCYHRPASRGDLDELFIKRFDQLDGDEQLAWIGKSFGFRPVESEEEIYPDSIYFIRIEDESFLVQTRSADQLIDGVALASVTNNVPMKTYTKEAFVRLGTRRRMVLLTKEFEYAG